MPNLISGQILFKYLHTEAHLGHYLPSVQQMGTNDCVHAVHWNNKVIDYEIPHTSCTF